MRLGSIGGRRRGDMVFIWVVRGVFKVYLETSRYSSGFSYARGRMY